MSYRHGPVPVTRVTDADEPDARSQSAAADALTERPLGASRAAVLVDGSNYFAALRAALLDARSTVFIAGWDIDSRTAIRGETPPSDGAPETLGELLTYLVERTPTLEIFLLLWDYSVIYVAEREPLPRVNLDWRTPDRVNVCLDAALPVGASHHEKLVVIDDALAFCGGLDLTIRRWDTPAHRVSEAARCDPGGAAYDPFHDVHCVVDGEAAAALAAIVRDRWASAGGGEVPASAPNGDPWPDGVEPELRDFTLRIVRTRAAFRDRPAVHQVETAYLRAIEHAERFIYIESQYLTTLVVADAIRRRLDACAELEVLLVSSLDPGGWLEAQTMGAGRDRFLAVLADAVDAGRVRALHPFIASNGERLEIKVHSKLMIVDDNVLHIGSSNLNNRSMRVDTESDLVFEARNDDERAAIGGIRRRLIAEHLGVEPDALAAHEQRSASLLGAVDAAAHDARGLTRIPSDRPSDDLLTAALNEVADPEAPIDPEAFVGDLFGARRSRPLLHRAERLLIVPVVLLLLFAAWHYLPLGEWLSPQRWLPMLQSFSDSPWGGPAVLLIYVVGCLVIFPITVLIAATAITFGPWSGFLWATCGCVLGGAANFAVGRWLGRRFLAGVAGKRFRQVSDRLARGGIVPVMVLRNLPIAPYAVVSMAAGASSIRLRDFVLGTALGMAPGIGALTLLGDRLRGVWQHPTPMNVGLLALAITVWIGLALGLQSASNRLRQK